MTPITLSFIPANAVIILNVEPGAVCCIVALLYIGVVRQGMRQVVSVHTSSSALINQINVAVAGKTGTAQQSEARPNHALFVSFAPYENPEVTVTSVIPFGYSSGNSCILKNIRIIQICIYET